MYVYIYICIERERDIDRYVRAPITPYIIITLI